MGARGGKPVGVAPGCDDVLDHMDVIHLDIDDMDLDNMPLQQRMVAKAAHKQQQQHNAGLPQRWQQPQHNQQVNPNSCQETEAACTSSRGQFCDLTNRHTADQDVTHHPSAKQHKKPHTLCSKAVPTSTYYNKPHMPRTGSHRDVATGGGSGAFLTAPHASSQAGKGNKRIAAAAPATATPAGVDHVLGPRAHVHAQQRQPRHRQAADAFMRKLTADGCDVGDDDYHGITGAQGGAISNERWCWLGADRRDGQGRCPGDPDYDPSTLYIPLMPSSA
eukprot:jgi/Chrzof1/5072/Cz15g10220.t1